ncbi:MAG: MFS transporter family protein [Candidatus Magasanikbacteria bacterium]|nr:MFS transporter family protein [Candidatus Magasanikbacteria bacterium]
MPVGKLSKNDIWFGIVSLLNDISSEMIFPVLPLFMATVLAFNKSTIGIIEGLGAASALILQAFSGYISDRRQSRKPIAVIGYALSVLTKPFFAFSQTVLQVIGLRMIDRGGKGIRTAPRDALISETQNKSARGYSFGFNRMMDTSGAIIGTLIAFLYLAKFPGAYRTIFWISFFPGLLAVAALIIGIKDVKRPPSAPPPRKFIWTKVSKHAKFFFLVSTVFALANASYAFFLLRALDVGIADKFIPLLFLVYSVFAAIFFTPIGRWTDKAGRAKALLAGYLLFAAVAYFFTRASATEMWLLFALYGIAIALNDGVSRALVADLTHPEVRGTAYGIYFMLQGVAAFAASFLFGALWDKVSRDTPFIVASLLSLLAAILFLIFMVRHKGHGHFGEKVSSEYHPSQ